MCDANPSTQSDAIFAPDVSNLNAPIMRKTGVPLDHVRRA